MHFGRHKSDTMEFKVPIITKVFDRRGSGMERATPLPKTHAQKVRDIIITRTPTLSP